MIARDRRWKKRLKELVEAVQAILREWDPIGILPAEFGPQDEYDGYAPHFVSMLAEEGATVDDVTRHLEHLRTKTIGCPANRDADRAIAQKLVALWLGWDWERDDEA